MNDPNLRRREDPILKTLLANQNFMLQDPRSLKESSKRPVTAVFRRKKAAVNGTARSHNFTGAETDTASANLSWYTFSETVAFNLSSSADNVVGAAEHVVFSLQETQRILRERIGLDFVTKLHAGRNSGPNASTRLMAFNDIKDAFENPLVDASNLFYNIQSIMRQEFYRGQLDMILDPVAAQRYAATIAQGSGNSTNQQFQFQNFATANEHTALGLDVAIDAAYTKGAAIVMPQGVVSVLPWIPKKYRDGFGDNEFNEVGIGTTIPDMDGLPLTYTLRGYTVKADTSANNGDVDDLTTHWQLSVDMSFNIAPTETAGDVPVYLFAQL
jgi:hypothetical protein